jgi:hypothetical protein
MSSIDITNPNNLCYLVSSIDLKQKIRHKIKIVQYKDLFTYDNLVQLLPNKISILVILINTSPSGSGHWTVLMRQDILLTYFDSYGKYIDEELKYISNANRMVLHETKPYLSILVSKLVNENNFTLTYNKIDFQRYANGINTCGKYEVFITNSLLNGLNLQESQKLLKHLKKRDNSYDNIVNNFLFLFLFSHIYLYTRENYGFE